MVYSSKIVVAVVALGAVSSFAHPTSNQATTSSTPSSHAPAPSQSGGVRAPPKNIIDALSFFKMRRGAEGELDARDFEDDLEARELEERNFWQSFKKDVGAVAGPAISIASKFLREDEQSAARELEERNFWQSFKKDVGAVAGPAISIASKFLREDEEFVARELEERDVWSNMRKNAGGASGPSVYPTSKWLREDDDELFARGNFLQDFGHPDAAATATSSVSVKFTRAEDDLLERALDQYFGRDVSELSEREIEQRSKIGNWFKNKVGPWFKKHAGDIVSGIAKVATKILRDDHEMTSRELEAELYGRLSEDDLVELMLREINDEALYGRDFEGLNELD